MEARSAMKMKIGIDSVSCAGYKRKAFSNVSETLVIIESHVGKYYTSGKNEKKQMEAISEIQPIEFIDLIALEYEKSSSSEEIKEDQSQIILFLP